VFPLVFVEICTHLTLPLLQNELGIELTISVLGQHQEPKILTVLIWYWLSDWYWFDTDIGWFQMKKLKWMSRNASLQQERNYLQKLCSCPFLTALFVRRAGNCQEV